MNDHEKIRELLSLAAADALSAAEKQVVESHLSQCSDCAAALAQWHVVTQALRRLPTPQPSPRAVERARAVAVSALEAARSGRESSVTVILLGLFAWSLTVAGWVISLLVSGDLAAISRGLAGQIPLWLVIYTVLGWIAAATAAAVLGSRRQQGRLA